MSTSTLRSITKLTVAAALCCSTLAGCGDSVVLPRVEVTSRSMQGVNFGTIVALGGSYHGASCLQRSGLWSTNLPASLLSVIKGDAGCQLDLSTVVMSAGFAFLNTAAPPTIGQDYGLPTLFSSSSNDSVFVNARNDKANSFDGDFVIDVLLTDTPEPVVDTSPPTVFSVPNTQQYLGNDVPPPDLVLAQDIAITVNPDRTIKTISGSAALNDGAMYPGVEYATLNGGLLNLDFASVKGAFAAATKSPVGGPPLMLNTFGLTAGMSLSSPIYKTVIVANYDVADTAHTTPSFRVYGFKFFSP